MQKKFLGNVLFIILLNVIVKPLYIFGIDVQVQNSVGASDYGLYFTLLNISLLFNMLLDIGITNFNARNIARHPILIRKHLSSLFGLKLLLTIPYSIITVLFVYLSGYDTQAYYWLSFFIVNQILASFILYVRSNFAGLHLFKLDGVISILDRLIVIPIIGVLLYGNITSVPFRIEWFIYAQTVAYVFTLLVSIILVLYKVGTFKFQIKKAFSIAIIKKSIPFALLILLMTIYTRIDAIMLERMLPDGKIQSGIYAQDFRLLDALNMFAYLVAGILLPLFSRLIKNKQSVLPVLQTSGKFLIGVSIVVAVGLSLNSYKVIDFIYLHNVDEAANAFVWLSLCFIPLSMSHIFSTLLTANHNLRKLNLLAFGGIVVNIILNYLLIPTMKAEGAAIATFTTQLSVAILQVVLVLRVFKFTINWIITRNFGALIIMYILFIYGINYYLNSMWNVIFAFIGGGALLFICRLLTIRDLLQLVSDKTTDKDG